MSQGQQPRRRVLAAGVTAAIALGAIGAAPVAAGAPDMDWGWVTIRTPSVVAPIAAMDRGNAAGGVNTYTRSGPGDWTVTFPSLGVAGGVAFVSPFRADRLCTTSSQNGFGGDVLIRVHCVDPAGTPRDSRFSLVFLNANSGSEVLGHLWAGHPGTTTYTVDPFYSYNSAGLLNRVKVLGTGRWQVRFKGLGANGGHLQVQPITANSFFPAAVACQVESWGVVNTDLLGTVACYDADGDPVDTRFYAAYLRGTGFKGDGTARGAYLFNKQPGAAAPYTAPSGRSFNSTGGPITIERDGTGVYRATLDGLPRGGAAVVTAYGTNGHRCSILAIRTNGTPQRVKVKCVDETGTPANTKFLLSWVK